MSESAKKRCADPKWIEAQHNRGTKLPIDVVEIRQTKGLDNMKIKLDPGAKMHKIEVSV